MSAPVITRVERVQSRRQHTLVKLSARGISVRLGFEPEVEDPERVEHVWNFLADGVPCAVWSFRGAHRLGWWSAFGPRDLLARIFGAEHLRPEPTDDPAAHTADAAAARSR